MGAFVAGVGDPVEPGVRDLIEPGPECSSGSDERWSWERVSRWRRRSAVGSPDWRGASSPVRLMAESWAISVKAKDGDGDELMGAGFDGADVRHLAS